MADSALENPSLVRDLVAWVAAEPRSYEDVMEAWRTSCPRLTIWEDAVDAQLLNVRFMPADGCRIVSVTDEGRRFLKEFGRSA